MANGIGEVFTYRKQGLNAGYGVYDPNKVFFVEDPNGKVKVDGNLCKIVREKPDDTITEVTIGDITYNVIELDGLYWITENLKLDAPSSKYNPSYPEFGNYYKLSDLDVVASQLTDGWRIGNDADFTILGKNSSHSLQSVGYSAWPDATNETKFSAVPNRYYGQGTYDRAMLWSSNSLNATNNRNIFFVRKDINDFYNYGSDDSLDSCIRLCKTKNPVNLFDKSTSYMIEAYCGTIDQQFVINVNHGAQRTLVIPTTDKMRNKTLRLSWDNGDSVQNRCIGGQVNEIPSETTYYPVSTNKLWLANAEKVLQRSYVDCHVGDFNYIVFFFDSGLADTSKFIDSLVISADGWYYDS